VCTYGHEFLLQLFALHLQVQVYQVVVLSALLVVAFEDGPCVGALLHLAHLNGDLCVLAPLLLLLLRVVFDTLRSTLELPEAGVILGLLLQSIPGHTHGEFLFGLLQERDLGGELGDFVHEVDVDLVVPLGVELDELPVQLDEFGEVGLILVLAVGVLLPQDGVDELLGQAARGFFRPGVAACSHRQLL